MCVQLLHVHSDEEQCIAFVSGTRAYEEVHHTTDIENLTPAMMDLILFPKPTAGINILEDVPAFESSVPLADALALLGLTDLPTTRGQLYMAAYAKMKESETSLDEKFPTKAELREAREVCKAAFDAQETAL